MNIKTKNLKSKLGYNLGGISNIWLLDIDNFTSYKFKDDHLADKCIIDQIIASDNFIELESINESNFTENFVDGVYKQKLSSFIYPLSGEYLAIIESLKNKKYIVAFQSQLNQSFCFGGDGGATLTFSSQTGQGNGIQGYNIVIEKSSTTPIYEMTGINNIQTRCKYVPVFEDGVFCQLKNGTKTGFEIAKYVLKVNLKGEALDINNNRCQDSRLPQAIFLLKGLKKPEGDFAVEDYYNDNTSHIQGYSITKHNNFCDTHPESYISLSVYQIILNDDVSEVTITLTSSLAWKLSSPPTIASINKGEGGAGSTEIKITKKEAKGNENILFISGNKSVLLNIINSDNPLEWVLKTEDENTYFWNENGYWLNNEKWR